ncbi:DUF3085 domain-containing protein [Streptomyces sp. NPDC005538]|uniref:DUF3085 domain-containing protein n=1 Tax=Streptomyces sp. NPDC005538 TaxID=3157043 RepID=UPI0033AEF950
MTNPTAPTTPEDFSALLREVLGANHQPPAHHDCTLAFPLDKVRSIAELAIAARKHALGPGDPDARPRLWWIKGNGTFLMSNGIDNTPHTHDADGQWHHIVYADKWGPDTDPSPILGGDDLHETLDLTQPLDDGQLLIDMLREAPDHATRFLLHITHDDEGMLLSMTTQ